MVLGPVDGSPSVVITGRVPVFRPDGGLFARFIGGFFGVDSESDVETIFIVWSSWSIVKVPSKSPLITMRVLLDQVSWVTRLDV